MHVNSVQQRVNVLCRTLLIVATFVRVQRLKVCCDNRGYRTKVSRHELTIMLSDVQLQTSAVIQSDLTHCVPLELLSPLEISALITYLIIQTEAHH